MCLAEPAATKVIPDRYPQGVETDERGSEGVSHGLGIVLACERVLRPVFGMLYGQ